MPDLDLKMIGERVKTQRKLLGLSRDQLAEATGISYKFLSDIELGLRGMSTQTLYNVSGILHLTVDYILSGIDNQTEEEINRITGMLGTCETDKLKYIEGIVRNAVELIGK